VSEVVVKPRISKAHGRWWCSGGPGEVRGCGATPRDAYTAWCKNSVYYRRLMALGSTT
jgi:hypothetical protein